MIGSLRLLATVLLLSPAMALAGDPTPVPTPGLAPFVGHVERRIDLTGEGKPDSFAVYDGTKLLVLYGQANRLVTVDTETGKVEDKGTLVPRAAAADRGWFPSAVWAPDGNFYVLRGRIPEFELSTWTPAAGLKQFASSQAGPGGGGAGELRGLAIAADGTLVSMADSQVRVWDRDSRSGRTVPTQTVGMNSVILGSCQPMSSKGGWVTGYLRESMVQNAVVSDGTCIVGWLDFASDQLTISFSKRTMAGRMPSVAMTPEGMYVTMNNDAVKGETTLYKLGGDGAELATAALPKSWLDPRMSVREDASAAVIIQSAVTRPVDPYAKDPLPRPTSDVVTEYNGRLVILDKDLKPFSTWSEAAKAADNPFAVGDPVQVNFLENGKAAVLDRLRSQIVVIE